MMQIQLNSSDNGQNHLQTNVRWWDLLYIDQDGMDFHLSNHYTFLIKAS